MIISVSRRTDIPAYYADWFFDRLKQGFVYVRNPMNPRSISKVALSPDVVDGIVFWTKNPTPMLSRLDELRGIPFYFQFSLTPYDTDIECNLPSKEEVLIPTFHELSAIIGKERVVWRYDPILLNERYTVEFHMAAFERYCQQLSAYTEKCTVSFLDSYRSIDRRIAPLGIRPPNDQEMHTLACTFGKITKQYGLAIDTCAEQADLSAYGIGHAHCIDKERLERIGNYRLKVSADRNQRAACGCVSSIDIGVYNTCRNGCVYCYANHSEKLIEKNLAEYDPTSPLLCGRITEPDVIKSREMKSLIILPVEIK